MKKAAGFIFLLFIALTPLFSYSGLLAGERNLKVAATKYFDIIFPENCQVSASILYENADSLYEEIAADYSLEAEFRLPVVITSTVQQFNAYFSAYPYNHIVLYDTGLIEDLSVFSQTFLSTFKHELTHAISFNHRCKGLYNLDQIFGDPVNGLLFTITSGWAEGAAVTSESKNGEGRLNDEYFLQTVKQAKIEGKFPSYADVQGARSVYPLGSFYNFNAAFAKWLQENYGMEKYAEFWYTCVNFKAFTAGGAFKKVYGLTLKQAWKNFTEAFEIPQVLNDKNKANPVEAGLVQDFFVPENTSYSDLNSSGAVYSNLVNSKAGIAYLEEKTGAVYFVGSENLKNQKIKPEKLFTQRGISKINLSEDGRYLLCEYYTNNKATVNHKLKAYDLKKKSFLSINIDGFQEAALIQQGDEYFVAGQKYNSRQNEIWIFNLKDRKTPQASAVKIKLLVEQVPFSFCDCGNGEFAYILKDGLDYSVITSKVDGTQTANIPLPENQMKIRYLSFSGGKLYFSYSLPGCMPREGKLDLINKTWSLSNTELSGGVFYPVFVDSRLIYIGNFFLENRLLFKNEASDFINYQADFLVQNNPDDNPDEKAPLFAEEPLAFELPSWNLNNYNPLKYYRRGLFLPVSDLTSISPDSEHSGGDYSLPLGLTYVSSNPWDSNFLQFALGYGLETNSFGVQLTLQNGTATSLFNYTLSAFSEFDFSGFKQARAGADLSSGINFGKHSYAYVSDSALMHYGRSNKSNADISSSTALFGSAIPSDSNKYFYAANVVTAGYSQTFHTGPGSYETLGFSLAASLKTLYLAKTYPDWADGSLCDLGFYAKAFIPQLLPVNCKTGFTYNLPLTLSAYLFTEPASSGSEYFASVKSFSLASARVESVLFAMDIQKAVPFATGLFLRELKVSFIYTIGADLPLSAQGDSWKLLSAGKYIDYVSSGETPILQQGLFKVNLSSSLNFGQLASYNYEMNLYLLAGLQNLSGAVEPAIGFGFSLIM